jgi:hypothetical protein
MADTQEPKGTQATPPDQETEENAWPSWLSWVLVIAAGVFGGYLLGARGGDAAGSKSASQLLSERRANEQIRAQYEAQFKIALEMAQRANDERTRSFCREVLYTGLLRDGLEQALSDVNAKLAGTVQGLSAPTTTKPEDRLARATTELKQIQETLARVAGRYGQQNEAMKRVNEFGRTDQGIQSLGKQLAYLYYDHTRQLMREAAREREDPVRQAMIRQAGVLRTITGQLDPNMAAELGKQYPELALPSPASAPSSPPQQKSAAP